MMKDANIVLLAGLCSRFERTGLTRLSLFQCCAGRCLPFSFERGGGGVVGIGGLTED